MIKLKKVPDFERWLLSLRLKERAQIEARLFRIEEYAHFGDWKPLEGTDHTIAELRWKNGWRVYFSRIGTSSILLLLGGKKNDQKEDIKKARTLFRKYADCKN